MGRFPRATLLDPTEVMSDTDEFWGNIPANVSNPAHSRYIYTSKWLFDHRHDYDKVIITDIRDIAIYADPFDQIQYRNKTQPSVQTFTEIETYREQGDRWNQPWVRNCYGETFLESIMDEKITCCGLVAGTMDGLIRYSRAFLDQLRGKHDCDPAGADTAIHVWIIHRILTGVQIVDSEYSLIRHMPHPRQVTDQFDITTGGINNGNGQPYALIHQYDRSTLYEAYLKRHDIKSETIQFQNETQYSFE